MLLRWAPLAPLPCCFFKVGSQKSHLKVTRAEGGSESCGLLLQCWDDRHVPSQDGTQPLRMPGTRPTNLSYILNPWQSSCLTQQVLFVEAIPQGFLSRQPHLPSPGPGRLASSSCSPAHSVSRASKSRDWWTSMLAQMCGLGCVSPLSFCEDRWPSKFRPPSTSDSSSLTPCSGWF